MGMEKGKSKNPQWTILAARHRYQLVIKIGKYR
jgi:hypothetical protein